MKDAKGAVSFRAVMKKELEVCVHGNNWARHCGLTGRLWRLKEEGLNWRGGYDSELHPGCEERRYVNSLVSPLEPVSRDCP